MIRSNYSYTLGVVKVTYQFMIQTDSKHLLKLYLSTITLSRMEQSVYQYVVEKEIKDEQIAYDYEVKIAAIDNILTKDIKIADDVLRDTIGNDLLVFRICQLQMIFLVEFSFFGDSKTHYFDLVYDDKNQKRRFYHSGFPS